jgi:hypothetical protein
LASTSSVDSEYQWAGVQSYLRSTVMEASTNMPLTAPGTLTRDEYLSIMAYLLAKNGHPAGKAVLTANITQASTARF